MGWTFLTDYSRTDIIAYLRRNLAHGDTKVVRSSAIGNNFWALCHHATEDLYSVAHIIIQGGTRNDPSWGYKELSHRDGDDCPVSYLAFLPPTADSDELAWRASVQKHHQRKRDILKAHQALTAGVVVTYGGRPYRLLEPVLDTQWRVVDETTGDHYRMSKRQLLRALREQLAAT